jgi:[acyl-carrier-protein] S-malonyltransferase
VSQARPLTHLAVSAVFLSPDFSCRSRRSSHHTFAHEKSGLEERDAILPILSILSFNFPALLLLPTVTAHMHKTALLFAGQGAQYVGMGKDLADQFPAARSRFEQASQLLGYDLATICFAGPETELTRTEHAQPGIYLVSWIAFELLRTRVPHLTFHATAGLSLGEFTALAAAGGMPFQAGLSLVQQRGRFMQEACDATQGAMAAVIGLDEVLTREVCSAAGVELANLNCPGQIVISGESECIDHACELARAKGARKALPLSVAGAYHSRLMQGAQPKLAAAVAAFSLVSPSVPVISNVDAQPHVNPEEIAALLVQQIVAPVRWEASMRHLLAQGYTRFIEFGPGRTLNGFLKRIDREVEVLNVGDVSSLEETSALLGKEPAA